MGQQPTITITSDQTLFHGTHCADNVPGFRYTGQYLKDRESL